MRNALLEAILALPSGHAIFDMDGTLIKGDLGEAVLQRILKQKERPLSSIVQKALGTEDPWKTYQKICEEDFCYGGDLAAQALCGWSGKEIENMVEDAFLQGDVQLVPEVVALAQKLLPHHQVWILTGSARVIGQSLGNRIGIQHVVGMELEQKEGVFTDTLIPPCTCGKGKVEAAQALISAHPVFSIGDSPSDLPLLRTARIARTLGRIFNKEFPGFS